MKTLNCLIAGIVLTTSGLVSAGVNCQITQTGVRWNHICSEDGAASSALKCRYSYNVLFQGGNAAASQEIVISRKQQNVIVWSNDRWLGKPVTGLAITSGRCDPA